MREFKIFLPLYDGVKNIEIGIDSKSSIKNHQKLKKPIIFYGTSITQGGCIKTWYGTHEHHVATTRYRCL